MCIDHHFVTMATMKIQTISRGGGIPTTNKLKVTTVCMFIHTDAASQSVHAVVKVAALLHGGERHQNGRHRQQWHVGNG